MILQTTYNIISKFSKSLSVRSNMIINSNVKVTSNLYRLLYVVSFSDVTDSLWGAKVSINYTSHSDVSEGHSEIAWM